MKLIIPGNFRIRALLRLISSDNSFLITALECESTSRNSGYNTKFFLVCYDAVHLVGINPLKMKKQTLLKKYVEFLFQVVRTLEYNLFTIND